MLKTKQHRAADELATYLETLARTSLTVAANLRSLHSKERVHFKMLHIRIGRVLEHAPPSAVCRQVDRQPIAQEA